MPVVRIPVRAVLAQAWEGYENIKTPVGDGLPGVRMPSTVAWFEPEAADKFAEMQEACGWRMQFTDMYRSVSYQIKCIKRASEEKRRLYAPPTKSGHNFAWSFDLSIRETLMAFRRSGNPELVAAGKNRNSLVDWMRQFGWTGIRKERWHFNFLGKYPTTTSKINAVYGDALNLSNKDVQRCLNRLLDEDLVVDGILGRKSHAAALKSASRLGVSQNLAGGFTNWYRRVLAGATAVLVNVDA